MTSRATSNSGTRAERDSRTLRSVSGGDCDELESARIGRARLRKIETDLLRSVGEDYHGGFILCRDLVCSFTLLERLCSELYARRIVLVADNPRNNEVGDGFGSSRRLCRGVRLPLEFCEDGQS